MMQEATTRLLVFALAISVMVGPILAAMWLILPRVPLSEQFRNWSRGDITEELEEMHNSIPARLRTVGGRIVVGYLALAVLFWVVAAIVGITRCA